MAAARFPAHAERGLPQSMQKREAGSLAAPQKLHAVMQTPQAGKMAWAANIGFRAGGWQCAETPMAQPMRPGSGTRLLFPDASPVFRDNLPPPGRLPTA